MESVAAEPAFIETSRFRPAIHPNPCAPNRGEAVRYLRLCFPDRLPGLLEAFARDPDEEMRYQLSEFLRDSDQEAAVGMKIGMLGNASPERQELLINEIAELGNLWHLEGLHGLASLASGHSVFARAAGLLAKRTKTWARVVLTAAVIIT